MAAALPPVRQQAWPGQAKGKSITHGEMARLIRDGATNPSIQAMAGSIVKRAGSPSSARDRVDALREHVKREIMYAPDPPMTEMIKAAHLTLCSEGSNALCIPIGDCDDLAVALGSMIGSIGIDVRVLGVEYGLGIQPHVLLEFQDDGGRWLTVDPSPPFPPIGYQSSAVVSSVRTDPWDPKAVPSDSPDGKYVGVGATAPTPIAYQTITVPGATTSVGLRYRLGMTLTFESDPTGNYRMLQETTTYFSGKGWVIEHLDPHGPPAFIPTLNQWVQGWVLQGLSAQAISLTNDDFVTYLVGGVQASGTSAVTPGGAPGALTSPLSSINLSVATGVAIAVGLGAAAGAGYFYWKRSRP